MHLFNRELERLLTRLLWCVEKTLLLPCKNFYEPNRQPLHWKWLFFFLNVIFAFSYIMVAWIRSSLWSVFEQKNDPLTIDNFSWCYWSPMFSTFLNKNPAGHWSPVSLWLSEGNAKKSYFVPVLSFTSCLCNGCSWSVFFVVAVLVVMQCMISWSGMSHSPVVYTHDRNFHQIKKRNRTDLSPSMYSSAVMQLPKHNL